MSLLEDIVIKHESVLERVLERATHCVIINNHHGVAIKSTLDNTQTQGIIKSLAGNLVTLARSCVRDVDPNDDLAFFRVMTKKFEYLISPEVEFTIVLQQHRVE